VQRSATVADNRKAAAIEVIRSAVTRGLAPAASGRV